MAEGVVSMEYVENNEDNIGPIVGIMITRYVPKSHSVVRATN